MSNANLSLLKHFAKLTDPRIKRRKLHLLPDIVAIALCAVISGANKWEEIALFGVKRQDWLSTFLALPNGIPSHDTFERVFARLKPQAFGRCFGNWMRALGQSLGLKQIAIDGKTLRGSKVSASDLGPLHVVSAWATENHLSLAQVAVENKSNEIKAIPQLLELLDIEGALVSIDAIGCQKKIARQIVEQGGDYVLAVKENQEHLYQDIRDAFARAIDSDYADVTYDEYATAETGHGRKERRWYTVISDPQGLRHQELWQKLHVIGMCLRERTVAGKTSTELHYFIGSRHASAKVYGEALRGHWAIENNLHWQLDVTFAEDASRIHNRYGAENFSWLRRVALMLLKRHPSKKSMASKRYEATLDPTFLDEILHGANKMGKV